jgi:hypothetical protein
VFVQNDVSFLALWFEPNQAPESHFEMFSFFISILST